MPRFAHPWLLLLLLVLPPLIWWWLRQRHGAMRHPATTWLARLPSGRSRWARWGGTLLRTFAMLALILALAGPRWPDLRTRIVTEGIAVAMVVDVSGSMAERDFDWQGEPISRLDAVKRVFRLFVAGGAAPDGQTLEGRPTDLMGLITFGTRPDSACPLTLSHSVLLQIIDAQQPRSIPGESETNISDAITLGLHRLKSAGPRRKVMILLSDGEHNVAAPSSGWTPRQAAQIAANLDIPIHTIDASGDSASGSGREASPTSAVTRDAAVQTLREVASISGGEYYRAKNTESLLEVYRLIDAKERARIESFQYRRYHEGYPWFALASFVLLMSALVLDLTLWRRIP